MRCDEGDLSASCSDFAGRSGDSIHTAWHDTDSTVLSCLAGGVNWALIIYTLDYELSASVWFIVGYVVTIYIGWQWRNKLVFAAILWVKLS